MKDAPITVSPSTPTLEAVELMRARGVGCLPVVERGALVGIITAKDFLDAAAKLFEERLSQRRAGEPESSRGGVTETL